MGSANKFALCACLFFMISGCSSREAASPRKTESQSSTSSGESSQHTAAAFKPCELVTKSDANAVFGGSMAGPTEETIEDGAGMRCSYIQETQGNQKLVKVDFFPSSLAEKSLWSKAKDRFAAKKRAASSVRQITPISGIGDDAFDDGIFGLHILKGDVYFVITLKGFEGTAPTDEQYEAMIGPKRRAAAEVLARKIVAGVEKHS